MFRSLWSQVVGGGSLKRAFTKPSSPSVTAKCLVSPAFQNSRVTSIYYYSTVSCNESCSDSVHTLLKSYGFTEYHISKMISKRSTILLSNPHETLKPKLDFLRTRGLHGIDLANYISNYPMILGCSFDKLTINNFDFFKSILQSDQNVFRMIREDSWILSIDKFVTVMLNVEHLEYQGLPPSNIVKYLIRHPRIFAKGTFEEIVEKVKGMGFDPLQGTFLKAILVLTSVTEANWRKKMDVYKRWGWSEDQIQKAFRKRPDCMTVSEKKITEVMNFLVNEMGYDSSSIADYPKVLDGSLKERIIPRGSVIKILVSRGLLGQNSPISSLSSMVDKVFLQRFITKYEQEVPELMKVFQGQLNYQQLFQN